MIHELAQEPWRDVHWGAGPLYDREIHEAGHVARVRLLRANRRPRLQPEKVDEALKKEALAVGVRVYFGWCRRRTISHIPTPRASSPTPMIADENRDMSEEFNTLGQGMHGDAPGHAFVLVDRGKVLWYRDYWLAPTRSMYVEPKELLADIPT